MKYGGRNWKKISDCLVDRTDVQCLHRWQKVLRPGLVKGPWTKEVVQPHIISYKLELSIYCRKMIESYSLLKNMV